MLLNDEVSSNCEAQIASKEKALDVSETSQIYEAMENILSHLSRTMRKEHVAEILDSPDEAGISLIHYVTALDLHNVIELVAKHGACLNL